MSWEPRDPIGFSPCGMAFGAVRGAYKSPCKFFADDPTATNQIIWYYVPDDREVFDDWTVFWPRVDVALPDANSQFEREGLGRAVRLHYNGNDVYGFPGDHVHGDAEDFLGKSKRKKYYVGDTPPSAPCEGMGVFVKFGIGIEVVEDAVETCDCWAGPGPAEFDFIIEAPDYPEIDGMIVHVIHDSIFSTCTYHGEVTDVPGGGTLTADFTCWIPDTGIAYLFTVSWSGSPYGEWTIAGSLLPEDMTSSPWGFEKTELAEEDFEATDNAVTIHTVPFVGRVSVRLAMHIDVEDVAGPGTPMPIRLAMRVDVIDVTPPIETIPIGLAMKLDVIDGPPPIERIGIGMAFHLDALDP